MFNDVEKKLKIFSKVLVWLVLVAGLITSIAYAIEMDSFAAFMIGIVITLVAALVEYVVALFIYAFAELVENSKTVASYYNYPQETVEEAVVETVEEENKTNEEN